MRLSDLKIGDKIVPRKEVLTGTGTLWECILMGKGWNDSSDQNKMGVVVNINSNLLPDVRWEALSHTEFAMFPDEIMVIK